eukprot:820099_1
MVHPPHTVTNTFHFKSIHFLVRILYHQTCVAVVKIRPLHPQTINPFSTQIRLALLVISCTIHQITLSSCRDAFFINCFTFTQRICTVLFIQLSHLPSSNTPISTVLCINDLLFFIHLLLLHAH